METNHKPTILIIQNEYTARLLLKNFLKGKYNSYLAPNFDIARTYLEKNSIDGIVTSIGFHGDENGLDFIKNIRQERKKLPIIVITDYALATTEKECYDAGCDDYLTKPIDKDLLFKSLEKHIDNNANNI